jgi:hypothetical protein
MNDSTKDAQVCTKDHASQKATMGPGVIPQDQSVRKCPEGQSEMAFGSKPDAGGKE